LGTVAVIAVLAAAWASLKLLAAAFLNQ